MSPIEDHDRSSAGSLLILTRCRFWQFRNVLDQHLRDAPIRSFLVLALLALIWLALYVLLSEILRHVHGWELVGVVADQHLFVHFFVVLAIMLAFSNAILTYGGMYGRTEAGHLLALPLNAHDVVVVKWFESILLSSWSFMLLGVPMMLAIARNSPVEWYYYPMFLAHFLGFITIPACLGLLAAWAVAMWAPQRSLTIAIAGICLTVLVVIYWLANISDSALESEKWLQVVFKQIGIVKQPLLPSTWTAKGIVGAMRRDFGESLFYLVVVAGNGAFLSWVTVNVLAGTWAEAYSRAQRGRVRSNFRNGWFTAALCWAAFFYLSRKLRLIMLKDIRGFARDAKQWSQMLIMLGLLVIYVLNLRRMPLDLDNPQFKSLIAFLNLTTVSLILATFTSRFVYPLLSLESQQLWLIEMLPISRGTWLWVKFLFAMTITGLSACLVMGLAMWILDITPLYAAINLGICLGICCGLSGLSIGLGARFPVMNNRNPARIASGFGGTLNLIVSMLFVGIQMAGMGWLTFSLMVRPYTLYGSLTPIGIALLVALGLMSLVVGFGALWLGIRHFNRLET